MTNTQVTQAPSTFQFGKFPLNAVTDEAGVPWFNANEVCSALGFGNPRQALKSHVDPEDVQILDILTDGGAQQSNHVNESGLYTLIFGSKKAEAKEFKRWVTSEVLPSIRKTGAFVLAQAVDQAVEQVKLDYSEEGSAIRGTSPTYDIGRRMVRGAARAKPGKPWPKEILEAFEMAKLYSAQMQEWARNFDPDNVIAYQDDRSYAKVEFERKNADALLLARARTAAPSLTPAVKYIN